MFIVVSMFVVLGITAGTYKTELQNIDERLDDAWDEQYNLGDPDDILFEIAQTVRIGRAIRADWLR